MRSSARSLATLLPLATIATFGAGCGVILGIDDFTDAPGSTGTTTQKRSGGGGSGGTTSISSGGTSNGSGGTTSMGGSGGTAMICEPGTVVECYDGPTDTKGVGACKAGTKQCTSDGLSYGGCKGQVLPALTENCATPTDDNCNGIGDLQEGCCTPNDVVECYSGPVGTKNKGQCSPGAVTCNADGTLPQGCPGQVLPADEYCAAPQDEDCNGHNCFVWGVTKGGFGQEYGSAVAVEGFFHSVAVAGAFKGSINLGGGILNSTGNNNNDVFLGLFGPDGSHTWSKKFGMDGAEAILGVTNSGNGGIAIAGYYLFGDVDFGGGALGPAQNFDGFFVRLDGNGDHVFSQAFGGPGNQAASAVKNVSGGFIVAGSFEQTTTFGPAGASAVTSTGGTDTFVAKYNGMDNKLLWTTTFGNSSDQGLMGSVNMDADFVSGVSYVAGNTQGGFSIGSLALPGTTTGYLVAVDGSGKVLWLRGFNTGTYPMYVASSPGGPYIATTVQAPAIFSPSGAALPYYGGNDIVIAHYDPDGMFLWAQSMGATGDQAVSSIAADKNGLLLGGSYTSPFTLSNGQTLPTPGIPGAGAFVLKLDPSGNVLWAHAQGGDAPTVTLDSNGFVLMTGGFNGNADLGGGSVAAVGATDVFLAKLGI